MLQLKLSSALNKGRNHQHKVVCTQRTAVGLYVGTMQATEDGYTGHLLQPKHPLLPTNDSSGRLGFLDVNRDEAYEALALHVAKAAWQGSLGFEATCLDNCSKATRDAFVAWLVDRICDTRVVEADLISAVPGFLAIRIKKAAVPERSSLVLGGSMVAHKPHRSLQ